MLDMRYGISENSMQYMSTAWSFGTPGHEAPLAVTPGGDIGT